MICVCYKKITQINVGLNNKNYSETLCEINILLKKVTEFFEKEDRTINENNMKGILFNKTGQIEKFSTEKIIKSLLNLGIPLITTYQITESTIKKVKKEINTLNSLDKYLTTKDIRQMVSLSIQELSIEEYSVSELENWSNKYARRYGHNNRCVEIYNLSNGELHRNISYDYISKDFLDDIINTISHGSDIESEISLRDRKDMATEILSFINNCDLYRISYDLLKQLVIEIATQPPHPWMIYDKIRSSILEYDYNSLCDNLNKINKYEKNVSPMLQSVKLEILHHASALILGMHNYFFGCTDLASFYQLRDFLEFFKEKKQWNDAIQRSKLSQLLTDISFARIDINELIELVRVLSKDISKRKIASDQFTKNTLKFGEWAIQIYSLGTKQTVLNILNSNWSELTSEEVVLNIKTLFYSIFPWRKYNIKYNNNHFWISYSFITLPSFKESMFNPYIFFIYVDNATSLDLNFLKILSDCKIMNVCNTIFIIVRNNMESKILNEKINCFLSIYNIQRFYRYYIFTQDDLISLCESCDKVKWLDQFFINTMDSYLENLELL